MSRFLKRKRANVIISFTCQLKSFFNKSDSGRKKNRHKMINRWYKYQQSLKKKREDSWPILSANIIISSNQINRWAIKS